MQTLIITCLFIVLSIIFDFNFTNCHSHFINSMHIVLIFGMIIEYRCIHNFYSDSLIFMYFDFHDSRFNLFDLVYVLIYGISVQLPCCSNMDFSFNYLFV